MQILALRKKLNATGKQLLYSRCTGSDWLGATPTYGQSRGAGGQSVGPFVCGRRNDTEWAVHRLFSFRLYYDLSLYSQDHFTVGRKMVGVKMLYNWGRIAYFISSSPVNKTHTEDLAAASASLPLKDSKPPVWDSSVVPLLKPSHVVTPAAFGFNPCLIINLRLNY